MLKLRYDGNDNFSNKDGRTILKRARLEFTRRLNNRANNGRLLLIFETAGMLDDPEIDEFETCTTTSDWITKFCKLLENRPSVCKALNLLVNLDNHSDLSNYRAIIRNIFETLQLPKLLEVIDITHPDVGQTVTVAQASDTVIEVENQEVNQQLLPPGLSHDTTAAGFFQGKKEIKMVYAFLAVTVIAAVITMSVSVTTLLTNPASNEGIFKDLSGTVLLTTAETIPQPSNFTVPLSSINVPPTEITRVEQDSALKQGTRSLDERVTEQTPEDRKSPTAPDFVIHHTIIEDNPVKTTTPTALSIPQERIHNQLYFNHPFQIKNKTVDLCNRNAITTVVLSIDNHYDWDGIRIDCPTRIYNLKIEGSASTKNIDEILNQTSNIRSLEIQCNQISVRNNGLAFISQKPELKKLRALSLFSQSTESECGDVFSYLAGNLRHSQLQKFDLNGIAVNDKNTPEIQRILSKMSFYTPHEIILNDIVMQKFLDITSKGRSLKFSKFYFKPVNNTEAAVKTVDNLLINANYTKEFSTNVPFRDTEMNKVLKNFRRLRIENLNVNILVREGRSHISFNFTKSMKRLKKFELGLYDWRKGNHTENYLLLIDFSSLRGSLREFKISTNFKTKSIGSSVHCRGFDKSNNAQGGVSIELNLCPDCSDIDGCMRRRK